MYSSKLFNAPFKSTYRKSTNLCLFLVHHVETEKRLKNLDFIGAFETEKSYERVAWPALLLRVQVVKVSCKTHIIIDLF